MHRGRIPAVRDGHRGARGLGNGDDVAGHRVVHRHVALHRRHRAHVPAVPGREAAQQGTVTCRQLGVGPLAPTQGLPDRLGGGQQPVQPVAHGREHLGTGPAFDEQLAVKAESW